jgi:parallel beta-helix repeat protein
MENSLNRNMFVWAVLVLVLTSAPLFGATYYVASDGNDAAAGSIGAPWATVGYAADQMSAGDTCYIRGGVYYISSTIVFDNSDSGTSGSPVTFKAYTGEDPVFVGGEAITSWTLDSGQVYKKYLSDVNSGSWRFDQLFEDGVRSTKARFPNTGYLRTYSTASGNNRNAMVYKSGELPSYTANDYVDGQVVIWAYANWWQSTMPIADINTTSRQIDYVVPYRTQGGSIAEDRYFVQGIKDELDIPGEFFLDEPTGYLYYWPLVDDINDATIVAPRVGSIFEFKGSDSNNPVQYINIEGIAAWGTKFAQAYTERGFEDSNSSNRLSTEWAEGIIRMENASNITISGCKLYNSGFSGVYMSNYASYNTVENCEIYDCGTHGICLAGHGPGHGVVSDSNQQTYDNKFNTIYNNHVYENGQLSGDAGGVWLYQSGDNLVQHNHIHDMDRYGICSKAESISGVSSYGDVNVTSSTYWDFLPPKTILCSTMMSTIVYWTAMTQAP